MERLHMVKDMPGYFQWVKSYGIMEYGVQINEKISIVFLNSLSSD